MNSIIKKIELDLGGKRVSLTLEQAKKLKSALDELFGAKVEKKYISYPIEPYRPRRWDWERPYRLDWKESYYTTTSGVTCSVGSDSDTLKLTL